MLALGNEQSVAIQQRLEYVEKVVSDSADKHQVWKQISVGQVKLAEEHSDHIEQHGEQLHRIAFPEKLVGDYAEERV